MTSGWKISAKQLTFLILAALLLGLGAVLIKNLAHKPPPRPLPSQNELDELAKNPASLLRGQAVFLLRCALCHGEKGEGKTGANLTDAYWLHGSGSTLDILRISHTGVLDKGMPSWSGVIDFDDLNATAVYVRRLRGTIPASAKAPQGDLVKD